MIGGAEGGMGTTLILGAWMIGGIGAITEPGGRRTTDAIGGRGITGTADTTVVRTGGGICGTERTHRSEEAQAGSQGTHSSPLATRSLEDGGWAALPQPPGVAHCSLTPGSDRKYAQRGPRRHSFHVDSTSCLWH